MGQLSDAIIPRLIAGPTASGKSALALELARKLDGEIINADAMQVYADLRILTARPSAEDERCVPHHLYGTIDGAQQCSAGMWARQAAAIIEQVRGRGKVPIIVGGTGLYFKSLTEGLSPIPEVPEEIRARGMALYDELGGAAFREKLLTGDPEMAHLPPGDRQRLVRAWEVLEATGTPLSEFQRQPRVPLLAPPFKVGLILPSRELLYPRCDQRLVKMIEEGALEEVRILMERELPDELPVMKSLGVPELVAHLRGETTLEEAIAEAAMNTRRFAKRQMTWFRNQTPDWPVLTVESHEALL